METFLLSHSWLLFKLVLAVLLWYMGLRGLVLGRATERDNTVITGTDARKVGLLFLGLAAYLTWSSIDSVKQSYEDLQKGFPDTHKTVPATDN